MVKPVKKITAPLKVKGVDVKISKDEIIDVLKEVREK
jgi:hypothetical protein